MEKGKKKNTHTFIVSTNAVNSYGYRILTEGIDTEQYMKNPVVLYMHNRGFGTLTGSEIIGRTVSLKKEAGKLIAEVEFDEQDDFAKKIAAKVEGGFIKMSSLGADIIETSSDPKLAMPGQTLETVTKCKMIELSIVDIGGNDEALKLSKNGKPARLQLLNINQNNKKMSELKNVALALGKGAESSEFEVLQEVNSLKLAKENAEKEAGEWKEKYIHLQSKEAEKLVDEAVKLGLIPEDLKDVQVKAFENDFEGQQAKLSKLISEKTAQNNQNARNGKVADVIALTKASKGMAGSADGSAELSFDYLQKHDVAELRRIKEEEPEKYAQLAKDYAAGVRHKDN